MKYRLHKNFVKAFRKLSEKLKKRVRMRMLLFIEHPYHFQLNNHQLTGKYSGYYSINISGDYRAVYKKISESEVIFVEIGTHAQLYA